MTKPKPGATWTLHGKKYLPPLALIVFCLVLWEGIVKYWQVPKWLLPAPSAIAKAWWESRDLLSQHAQTTIIETTVGFTLAIVIALIIAGLMDFAPVLKRMLYPLLVISQTIPLIAIAPLLTLWLGYGLGPKIAIVILVCFFPITINFTEGLEASDPDAINLLRSMGASHWQIFIMIRWPNAMPSLFAGLKIAATYSVMAAIIGEWLGASSGLGVYLTRSSHSFLTDQVFAGILAISILSLVYFVLISITGRLSMPWYYQAKKIK